MKSHAIPIIFASIFLAGVTSHSLADAEVVPLTRSDVQPIAKPLAASQSEWSRTVVQIRQSGDLKAIIQLHQAFLAKHPDDPLAGEIGEALGEYQKMADAGAVKFHGKWMTPDQVEIAIDQGFQAARGALDAYAVGKINEARSLASAVLASDEQNTPALAILGLVACRSGNLPAARKHFEALAESDPGSLLAQNNLAVICFRQNQMGEGILHYISALVIAPDNGPLLDNVTEIIHSYQKAGGSKQSPLFQALSQAYGLAEANLETELAKKNLRRYGSKWITKEERDTAVNQVKSIRDQMALLETQFQNTKAELAVLNARVQQASVDYANAQHVAENSVGQVTFASQRTSNGIESSVHQGGASEWRDVREVSSQKGSLEAQRDVLLSRMPEFFQQGEKLRAELAAADEPFSGEQCFMDLDFENRAAAPSAPALAAEIKDVAPTASSVSPAISSRGAEAAVAGSDPEEKPPEPVHGGSYNPPSFVQGAREVHKVTKSPASTPKAPAPVLHPVIPWPRKVVPYIPHVIILPKIELPSIKIPEHGNRLFTPDGVVNLGSDPTSFRLVNGKWTVIQNGKVMYESGLPVYYRPDNGDLTGFQRRPGPSQPTGAWTMNSSGQAVRRSAGGPPLTGTWTINQNGRAVRK